MNRVRVTAPVRIPLTCGVGDVRTGSAANGRSSLHFFLTRILSTECSAQLAEFLQERSSQSVIVLLPKNRLRSFSEGLLLWTSIQTGRRPRIAVEGLTLADVPILPDPVKWLYGHISPAKPVTWAPDIILTASCAERGPHVFDARGL